jgi:hypothetical protein
MPEANPAALRHLDYSNRARRREYTAKRGRGVDFQLVARQRAAHAHKLQQQLMTVQVEDERLQLDAELAQYQEDSGVNLEVIGAPNAPLKLEPLDSPSQGIVLKNVRTIEVGRPDGTVAQATAATVFVRHGKLSYLFKRIAAYAAEAPRDHEPFVANIESIGLAAVTAFWTSRHPLPDLNADTWWEVWVRAGSSPAQRDAFVAAVIADAERLQMAVKPGRLTLPEHSVLLVKTTRQTLASAIVLLNFVSELRHPALTPAHFVEQTPTQQQAMVAALRARIVPVGEPATTAVCVLDTGVNRGHPLLADLLPEIHHDTVRQEWGRDDHHPSGHGTQMAGLAAYGDLTPHLAGNGPVRITHHLESVKILPRLGHNEPEHYGSITQQAMAQAEINAPGRQRVFSLAVTATDAPEYKETGKPSAWSAALDSYTAGYLEDDAPKRLVCVSAGNVRGLVQANQYPSLNELSSIEDPAQSWNALTIGAYTDREHVFDEHGNLMPDWTPLARKGGLCPESCTSVLWSGRESRAWPVKPDIVMEGGNRAADAGGFPSTFDSLSVLSTNSDIQQRLLMSFNATSAATALGANFAAIVQASYPTYWPETVRALMVHSADWTAEMVRGVNLHNKSDVAYVMRRFGFGVPNLGRALASARSRASLIAQDSLQPFEKRDSRVVTRDMMLYRLPWPKALLQQHAEAEVRLRVTLSYFIEPNPGSRIPNTKYRYAGCNLRFKVQTPTERMNNFIARVSDSITDEERAGYEAPEDIADGWTVGDLLRRRGSLHSDTWVGTAANLAQMEHLIVYPVNGWWKLRPQHKRYEQRIRYSLILTLETTGAAIDIYTPIQAAIPVAVVV